MCPAGKFQSLKGAGYCSLCPLGTYASTGQSVSTNCPAGKTTLSEGRYSVSECSPCAAGSVPVNAVCLLCGAGQEAASGQGTCSDCPGGKYATANDVACRPCEAGKYSAGGAAQCDECPGGKISTPGQATAAADCNDCAAGTFSDTDPADPRPEPASGVILDVTHTKAAKFVAHRVRQAPELWEPAWLPRLSGRKVCSTCGRECAAHVVRGLCGGKVFRGSAGCNESTLFALHHYGHFQLDNIVRFSPGSDVTRIVCPVMP